MKTIAISANTSWYIYNFRRNTVQCLIKHGFKVIVIAPKDIYSERLVALGVDFFHLDIDSSGTNPFRDFKTLLSFNKVFSNNKIDVILNFTPKINIYSSIVASRYGIKIINNIAGLGVLFINQSITSTIVEFLYRFSQRYAHKVFFQNEEDRQLFIHKKIVRANITDRLHGSGVDLSRFKVVVSPNDGKTKFLLIARMLYDKGIKHYVDAANNLKQKYGDSVVFYLLGFLDVNNPSAISKQQMQEWVDEGIVHYLGVSDSVEDEIAKVDCIVLPSYYREGVPKSLLEAGAMGKPIVTTDNVGCRETVEHGVNGFICEPRSSNSLAHMLDKIICMSHEQRLIMGACSRRKMEREFDENIGINKYLSSIEELLS